MRKAKFMSKGVCGLIVFMILAIVLIPGTGQQVSASPHIIQVPNDHDTIQSAVDAASSGDTILVGDGTYTENVVVDKALTIQSENGAGSTTVQAARPDLDVFRVTSNNTNIVGFTVQGATENERAGICFEGNNSNNLADCSASANVVSGNAYGICLYYCNTSSLVGNTVNSNMSGILVARSTHNTLTDNTADLNTHSGIAIFSSFHNTLTDNTADLNHDGINICDSSDNTLNGNTVGSNIDNGILISYSPSNTFNGNTSLNNNTGIYLRFPSASNLFHRNSFVNNNQNAFVMLNNSTNSWDNGYPSGGNYWSDYSGPDQYSGPNQDQPGSDGIGDTPYSIPGCSDQDSYPFTEPGAIVNKRPTASFDWSPKSPVVGQEVEFDASDSIDPDGDIVSYMWDFDDGSTAFGQVVNHTYSIAQDYTVTLTVKDNKGAVATTDHMFSASLMEGDVNQDGYVTLKDSTLIKKWLAGKLKLDQNQLICANTFDDGDVTLKDSTLIKKWLANPSTLLWEPQADGGMLPPLQKP